MNVAIAGLGGAGSRGHLPALARLDGDVRVTGAADPDAGRRAAFSTGLPAVPVFSTAEEMLDRVGGDVLVVATEPVAHAPLVTLGLSRGLHVVCEKPLSVSREAHATVAQACARRPDLALVPVHQYRYSPQWVSMSRWARRAARLHRPFTLTVDLQRAGTDPYAASAWRADAAVTGGMLADAGVHFLALAWTIDEHLELLAAVRQQDGEGREHSAAIVRVASGVLAIQASNGATTRSTDVVLRCGPAAVAWRDDAALVSVGARALRARRVGALSERRHVDSLYLALYRDLARNLRSQVWRMRRTAEALGVGGVLVALLEQAPVVAAVRSPALR